MDNFEKLIKKLRKRRSDYLEKLQRLSHELLDIGIDLTIAVSDETSKREEYMRHKLILDKLDALPSQKLNIKRTIKQIIIKSGAFSVGASLATLLLATIFIPEITTILGISAVAGGISFVANTSIVLERPIRTLIDLYRFEKQHDYAEEEKQTKTAKYNLDKATKKVNKLKEAKTKKKSQQQRASQNHEDLSSYIIQVEEAKTRASSKLGRFANEDSLNKVYQSDQNINDILRLERKMKNDK